MSSLSHTALLESCTDDSDGAPTAVERMKSAHDESEVVEQLICKTLSARDRSEREPDELHMLAVDVDPMGDGTFFGLYEYGPRNNHVG